MLGERKKYILFFVFLFLIVFDLILFKIDFQNSSKKLTFTMLDVGQGDALFIESSTGKQVLIDSGPSKKILGELSKVMPAFDKNIDAIIMTHPDQDHIGGFADILKNYKVGVVFESGVKGSSKTYQNLEKIISQQKIPKILAKRGMKINLGDNAVLDILFPDRDVSNWKTNDASVVAKLSYGKNSFILTGDAPVMTEKIILSENKKENLKSDFLKIAHHGSRSASSIEFLEAVSPRYALISVGADNKFGHPHKEILDRILQFTKNILRTDELGQIIIKCDKIEPCKIN